MTTPPQPAMPTRESVEELCERLRKIARGHETDVFQLQDMVEWQAAALLRQMQAAIDEERARCERLERALAIIVKSEDEPMVAKHNIIVTARNALASLEPDAS